MDVVVRMMAIDGVVVCNAVFMVVVIVIVVVINGVATIYNVVVCVKCIFSDTAIGEMLIML